jgi:beta-RFAP synthase
VINSSLAFATPELRPKHPACVTVRAPGRLHLGFLDPAASLGRRFGSLGVVISRFETVVQLSPAIRDEVVTAAGADEKEAERAAAHLALLKRHTGRSQPLRLRLKRTLPVHAGFGSGTQLALAVGRAFAELHGIEARTAELAGWLARGARSGVGIAGFDRGGLLLDGGPGGDGACAPLLARIDLPERWRVMLVVDPRHAGLSGSDEKRAIASLPPFPREAAAEICHRTLMQILPGAACADFASFAAGLGRMQQLLGEHFAPAQGGSAYTSAAVGRALQWMGSAGAVAVGQSSWGPTGFAILPSAAEAQRLIDAARAAASIEPGLELHVVQGRNTGAMVNRSRSPSLLPTRH